MRRNSPQYPPKIPLSWIALLRVTVGMMFLTTWGSNLYKGYYTSDGLSYFFSHVFPLSENPLSWYSAIIEQVILPIRDGFAPFQLIAEAILGLSLLIGIFTPWASAAGIFFLANTFLATFGHDWPWAYLLPIAILGVSMLTRSGRSLGVDAWFTKKYGEPPMPFLW